MAHGVQVPRPLSSLGPHLPITQGTHAPSGLSNSQRSGLRLCLWTSGITIIGEKHPEMVLRSWRPFRLPQGATSRTSSSSPTKSHTNFKGLITPDLGCFLAVSQVRKSPVTFTFICEVLGWEGEKGWGSSFLLEREGETKQPIREAEHEGEKL